MTTITPSWSRRWRIGWRKRSPSTCTLERGATGATVPGNDSRARTSLAERYRGIRPAFGYPACPDHSEKGKLFDLLGAERAGITLTETYAMSPAASVSGLYFSHPEARYFTVGPVGRDQIEDYATRKGMRVADVERWLTPNLSYEPVSA